MAHHKAAMKSIRQTKKRAVQNRFFKTTMRTQIKKIRGLFEENKIEEARLLLPKVYSVIDRSVVKGVIHRNTANRFKSRLTGGIERAAAGKV